MNDSSSNPRRIAAGITLAATLTAIAGAGPAPAASLGAANGITFNAKIPAVGASLPLFRLSATAAPSAFLAAAVHGTHGFAREGTRAVQRDPAGVVHAFADAATGEAQIFPEFTGSGAAARPEALAAVARGVFARPDVIPKDATSVRLGDAAPVFAAAADKAHDGTTHGTQAPKLLFTYIPAERFAAGLPVTGAGSRVTVGVGNDGSIRAFVRDWKSAQVAGNVAVTTSPAQAEREIAAQLQPLRARYGSVTVDSVTPAYYDGDKNFMQPVYEFVATLGARGTLQDHVRGYVPMGKLAEALPVIGDHPQTGPLPSAPTPARSFERRPDGNPSEITLGEYVNRNCLFTNNCYDMSGAYLNGFDSVLPFWYGPPIERTQYYFAYSFEVLGSSQYYLNSVNVAYTNPHGDWYLNTTIGNYVPTGDPWYVNEIGTGGNKGYGAAAGGQLATWIIDSCEVIPSYYDKQVTTGNGFNAFNYWWPVFQGLHRALGFRTQMLMGEDQMNYNIAREMALGANADSAFYNEVAAAGTFPTYLDTHLGLTVHYDRVSTMNDVRNASESIYSVQGQSAAGSLTNVWMGN